MRELPLSGSSYAINFTPYRYEFEGTYKNGVKHGAGRLRLSCGAVISGCWIEGKLAGQVDFTPPEGSVWEDPAY